MPYLHIQISGDADDALAANVARNATELTARLLGKDPSLTAVVVDFIAPSRWFIGGRPLVYLEAVHRAMGELLGGVAEHSYVHVADLRASAYGFGGRTQEHRYQHAG